MLTIVFGAGASYDSSPDYKPKIYEKNRLPLAKELFSLRFAHIAKDYQIALPLINRLRRASNIESELEFISIDAGSNIPEQLLKIRRYINQVIEKTQTEWESATNRNTVYYEFMDVLQKWQENTKKSVNLITFNYDTLLDTAFSTLLKVNFSDLDAYISNRTLFKLFKPHGSINWIHLAKTPPDISVFGDIDHLIKQLTWSPIFRLLSANDISHKGYYKIPAIAVPTETKTMFEFPNNHKKEMEEAIAKTTCLLCIGWKAEEKHFLKLWGGRSEKSMQLKKIEIVNSNYLNTDKIIENIKKNGNIYSPDITRSPDGFSRYVPQGLTKFLASISSFC